MTPKKNYLVLLEGVPVGLTSSIRKALNALTVDRLPHYATIARDIKHYGSFSIQTIVHTCDTQPINKKIWFEIRTMPENTFLEREIEQAKKTAIDPKDPIDHAQFI